MTSKTDPSPIDVLVVPTGSANLASVGAGLRRAGGQPVLTEDAELVRTTSQPVVLPGVGAFDPAMDGLVRRGLAAAIRDRIDADLPTMAVCVGFQLLMQGSEEAPGVPGIAVIPDAIARRFDGSSGLRVPQLGWNRVAPDTDLPADSILPRHEDYACFANSYRLESLSEEARAAGFRALTSDYGGPFVAAVERSNLVACQFHPELSSTFGAGILERFVAKTASTGAASPC